MSSVCKEEVDHISLSLECLIIQGIDHSQHG